MAKIKLHNPELATNSKFANLVIESLTTDPTLSGTTSVGRLWFNSTDKTFKGGFLDTDGTATEIKPISIDNSAEVATNTTNIATNTTNIATNTADISTNTTNIATNTADISTLQTNAGTLSTDVSTNTTNIATNTTNISNIQTELDTTQNGAGLGTDGVYTADATTNYLTTATSLTDADKKIDTQLKTNADTITQEVTDRTTADTALDGRITTLETEVGGATGDLTTLTTDTKTDLVSAINEVDANTDTNTTDIATNTTNIATNATNIGTNTTDISNLSTDLSTNYLNKTTTTAQAVVADTTFSGNLNIQGDLVVSGTSTTVETEILKVADNIITLNNGIGATTAPTENAGLEVDRGTEGVDTIIQWNETTDQVEVFEAGELRKVATTNYVDGEIATASGDISALDTRVTTNETNISSNSTAISDETTRATGVETNLQDELDATQTGAGLGTDGSYTADATTNYITTATDLVNADKLLDGQIKTNTAAITQEVTDRTTADTALSGRIDTLESEVGGATGDLTTLTTDAKSDLVSAINEIDTHTDTNSSDIATEITNRVNAISNVQAELDATQTGAGLGVDGSYTVDALTNYITTATDLANADKLLDGQIKTNADTISSVDTRLTTVESAVNGNIGDLTTLTTDAKDTLVNAINEVDSNINTEVTNRTTADNTLQSNIDTEASTRATADTDLGTRIDNVNTAAGISGDSYSADATTNYLTTATNLMDADKTLDTTIKTNLDNLAATTATNGTNLVGYEGYTEADTNIVNPTIEIVAGTLKASIDDIASSVNAKIHEIENRYVKGEVADADKADTYTIAHNLDTEFVDVSVQVYDAVELTWRFDLVITEVIDVNTVKISLASGDAEQIRYVIQGY